MKPVSRRDEQRALSFALAVAMHGLIAAMLYFGMQWQTKPALPVEVELWAGELAAAQAPAQPEPPRPEAAASAPAVVAPEPVAPARPDIEEEAPKPLKQPKPEKRPEAPRPEPRKPQDKVEKPERKPAEAAKPEAKPQKADKPKPEANSQPPKAAVGEGKQANDKAGKLSSAPLDASVALDALEKRQRAAEANAAAKAFEAYLAAVRNKIRRNMTYPEDGSGNPEAEFSVRLLPDMSVLDVRLIRSSGNPAFDDAVQRAILRAGEYPPLPGGIDFSTLRQHKLKYRLND